jgi:hypothetical protein
MAADPHTSGTISQLLRAKIALQLTYYATRFASRRPGPYLRRDFQCPNSNRQNR